MHDSLHSNLILTHLYEWGNKVVMSTKLLVKDIIS